jgi:hypothetical protein
MDKNIFFDSLIFLNKHVTDHWPTQINGYSSKHIFEGFSLSVEIDQGPIFLTNGTNDPAMFVSDLLVLESSLGSPSSSSTSLSQGTPKTSQRQLSNSQDDDAATTMTGKLLLRLDQTHVFTIDLYRIMKIYLQQQNGSLPTCFVIEFKECKFRFFSMTISDDRIYHAFTTLEKIPRHAVNHNLGIRSPTIVGTTLQSTQGKIHSLEQARQNMETIAFWKHSLPSSPEQTCQFLNTTATLLSASYVTPSEVDESSRAYSESLDSIHQELDDLLLSFFPRVKQLRRTTPQDTPGTEETDSKAKLETAVLKAQEILQRKHLTQEYRHKLVYLNIKGE